jgi:CRISPR-associated protein Csd2
MSISNKIDFAAIIIVKNANPNGDPLDENRPRTTIDGHGEISDVCLKRKIRNTLMDDTNIFVQSDDRRKDDFKTLKERAESILPKKKGTPPEEVAKKACEEWYDVRAFGQVFAFKGSKEESGVSLGIRGPISIQPAFSVDPVNVTSSQITKSVSNEGDGIKKSSDVMGMKYRVDSGVYVFFGAISPQLAEKTGFSDDDAELFKKALVQLFEGDASSARPAGSMEVSKIFWWKHNCSSGQYSSAKVHRSLTVNSDGSYELKNLPDLTPEIIEGF